MALLRPVCNNGHLAITAEIEYKVVRVDINIIVATPLMKGFTQNI